MRNWMAEKPCLGGIERKGSGKQALPATPSWAVSILRNGIRRGSFAPSRKTGRFKVLATAGMHLFILLFKQVEILIST